MKLRIKDVDYTVLADGFSFREAVGAEGKHETGTISMRIKERSIVNVLLTETGYLDATIWENDQLIYTGLVRPYATATARYRDIDSITVEVLDLSERFHVKICDSETNIPAGSTGIITARNWDGYKICDTTDTAHSVVHQVCNLAGVTIDSVPEISTTLLRFSLKTDQYLDEVFSELLYEYMYDYTFTAEGKLRIFSTHTDLESQGSISTFRESLQIDRSDSTKDGVIVTYPKYATKQHVHCLHQEAGYYPADLASWSGSMLDSDPADYAWSDPTLGENDNSDVSEIIYTNLTVEGWRSGPGSGIPSVTLHSYEIDSDKGQHKVRVSTSGGGSGYWWQKITFGFDLYADCSFLISTDQAYGWAGLDTEKFTLSYALTIDDAMAFAKVAEDRQAFSKFTYTFKSFEDFTPGDVYTIDEATVTGITTKIRILSKTRTDDTGLYSYEAEGFGSLAFREPDIDTEYVPSKKTDDEPDFFYLETQRTSYYIEEENDTKVIVGCAGAAFSRYGCSPTWYFNGNQVASDYGLTFMVDKSELNKGVNSVSARIVYDGTEYTRTAQITLVAATNYTEFQYTVTDTTDPPGESAVWSTTQPVAEDGQYIWMRMRVDSSSDWVVVRLTSALTKAFRASFDMAAYENNLRRVDNLLITVNVQTENMTSPAITYELVEAPAGVALTDNIITILPGYVPDSITVKVTVVDGSWAQAQSITIYGYESTENQPSYLGASASDPAGSVYIEGDSYFNTTSQLIMRFDGTAWQELQSTDSNYSQISGSAMADVWNVIDNDTLIKANWAYLRNIVAKNLTAEMIAVLDIVLLEGGRLRSAYYDADGEPVPGSTATSGIYINADGLLRAYRAILDNVEITAYNGDNTPLFATKKGYAAATYTHVSSGDKFLRTDWLEDGESIYTVQNLTYSGGAAVSYLITSEYQAKYLNSGPGFSDSPTCCIGSILLSGLGEFDNSSWSVTARKTIDREVNLRFSVWMWGEGSASIYKATDSSSKTLIGSYSGSYRTGTEPGTLIADTDAVTFSPGEHIWIEGTGTNFSDGSGTTITIGIDMKSYTDLAGNVGKLPVVGERVYIDRSDRGEVVASTNSGTCSFSYYDLLWVTGSDLIDPSAVPALYKNGVSAQDCIWRSTGIPPYATFSETFSAGVRYTAVSTSTIIWKSGTYAVTEFVLSGTILSFTTSDGSSFSVDLSANWAIAMAIEVKEGTGHVEVSQLVTDGIRIYFPIGYIYMSVDPTSPSLLFGGDWVQLYDTFLIGASKLPDPDGTTYSQTYVVDSTAVTKVDGEATHSLDIEEMPSHEHTVYGYFTRGEDSNNLGEGYALMSETQSTLTTSRVGMGNPHNNMPPYLPVYIWRRDA